MGSGRPTVESVAGTRLYHYRVSRPPTPLTSLDNFDAEDDDSNPPARALVLGPMPTGTS